MPKPGTTITFFASRSSSAVSAELIDDLKQLEKGWPKQVLSMQENWIGRSSGLQFTLHLDARSKKLLRDAFEGFEVYTTRPDTIYGVSYTALAPEHELVSYMIAHGLLAPEAADKITAMKNSSSIERQKET